MSQLLSNTRHIHDKVESVIDFLIIIPYSVGVPLALVNFLILAYSSGYWKQMRNKAENINDANYKKATMNYVKFGLASLVLLMEILIVLLLALSVVIDSIPCNISEYYLKCNLGLLDDLLVPLIIVSTMLPVFVSNMLCLYLTQVIAKSNVEFGVLYREGWITFWVCITTFVLRAFGIELVKDIGAILTGAINILLFYILCKRVRKLYLCLKSKSLDYLYEPKRLKYFRSQATNFKWSSLIIGISLGPFMILTAILTMYEGIFKLISKGLGFTNMMPTQFNTYLEIIHYTLQEIADIALINWALISTLLNSILLLTYIRKLILYRRFMSKPVHYKMMYSEDCRIVYKRVSY